MAVQTAAGSDKSTKRSFYGWWIAAMAFITFGLSVGVPYYNLPFFYDYFQKAYHWKLSQITLGFPIAALLTLWIGPLLVPRFSPRILIIVGTGLTALAFFGFSSMQGSLLFYYGIYFFYTIGYILSGPIPHQILVSQWFQRSRGRAMGVVYVGVGLFGGLGSFLVRGLTQRFDFHTTLMVMGGLMFLTWPLAFFLLKDRPSLLGQFPDGASHPPADSTQASHTFGHLFGSRSFWMLLIGSICSIGSIGSINMHMKLVFRDAGFTNQAQLDSTWTTASVLILWSSIVGRLSIGYLADMFSKKRVMTVTYFIVAATIPLLLAVRPPHQPYAFAIIFGFAMGADYMLIPLMAAEQFGVNTLSRAMAIILPVNTIGQTWFPYAVSGMREHFGNYLAPMTVVFAVAMVGAVAIATLPSQPAFKQPASPEMFEAKQAVT